MDPKDIIASIASALVQDFEAHSGMLNIFLSTLPDDERAFVRHLIVRMLDINCELAELDAINEVFNMGGTNVAVPDNLVAAALASGVSMN
jgi:hypothetical protein